jgi:drug/metabolite transporter (DMT)-like permease
MTKKSWSLFIAVGILWGIPYLLIRVAVRDFSPAMVVFSRVLIGALILVPLAIRQKSFGSALRNSKYIFLYAAVEIMGPWFLITKAEMKISSGLAGLLVATVPIWATIYASITGDKTVWHRRRLMGLIVGFVGLVAVVGIESLSGKNSLWAISSILVAAVGYALAPNMIMKKLPNVSGLAINALAMTMTAAVYAPFAILQWPTGHVSRNSLLSVIALGIFPTAMAFVVFFAVLKEMGPARASLVTYLNTAFAVLLGVLILSEPLTLGIIVGLPLVLAGSYFASRKPRTLS